MNIGAEDIFLFDFYVTLTIKLLRFRSSKRYKLFNKISIYSIQQLINIPNLLQKNALNTKHMFIIPMGVQGNLKLLSHA